MKIFKRLLPWLIYLSGCVVTYAATKYEWKKYHEDEVYTVKVRRMIIFGSLFSWLGLLADAAVLALDTAAHMISRGSDEPAKW